MPDRADIERLARLLCQAAGENPDEQHRYMHVGGSGRQQAWVRRSRRARQILEEREALAEFDRQERGSPTPTTGYRPVWRLERDGSRTIIGWTSPEDEIIALAEFDRAEGET